MLLYFVKKVLRFDLKLQHHRHLGSPCWMFIAEYSCFFLLFFIGGLGGMGRAKQASGGGGPKSSRNTP